MAEKQNISNLGNLIPVNIRCSQHIKELKDNNNTAINLLKKDKKSLGCCC